jgi:hypothetical protein
MVRVDAEDRVGTLLPDRDDLVPQGRAIGMGHAGRLDAGRKVRPGIGPDTGGAQRGARRPVCGPRAAFSCRL